MAGSVARAGARRRGWRTPAARWWWRGTPAPRRCPRRMSSSTSWADQDAQLARLHRVSRKRGHWDDLAVLAFDHRAQFKDLAQEAGAAESRIPELKGLLVRAAAGTEQALGLQGHVGALLDDTYGEDALFAASGRGWWVGRPVEVPGSRPLQFEGGRSIGTRLTSWPRDHVVKCLVRFRRRIGGGRDQLAGAEPRRARGPDRRRRADRAGAGELRNAHPRLALVAREAKGGDGMSTIRLTAAEAVVRYLASQRVDTPQGPAPLFGGVFAIFGHGNVAGLGEALYRHRETLPTLRPHNVQL